MGRKRSSAGKTTRRAKGTKNDIEIDAASETALLEAEDSDQELIPEGRLVCALTGERRIATVQEETLQSFIEQLHREYDIALEDMRRDGARHVCFHGCEHGSRTESKQDRFAGEYSTRSVPETGKSTTPIT